MCRLFAPGMFQASVSCHAEVSNTIRTPHASFKEKEGQYSAASGCCDICDF